MPIDLDAIRDLKKRANVRGRFYAAYHEWLEPHDPMPVHPVHGPMLCPPIDIIQIVEEASGPTDTPEQAQANAAVHVHEAQVPSNAAWEPVDSPENRKGMAFAEYLVACLNAFGDVS